MIQIAHFTEQDIAMIRANLDELAQNGKVGNADSIAQRLDAAINRANEPTDGNIETTPNQAPA